MAKRKKKKNSNPKKGKVLGLLAFILGLVILVSLVTHSGADDARLSGQVDGHMSAFKISYQNKAGMVGVVVSLFLLKTIGWMAFFVPLGFILLSLRLFKSEVVSKLELNSSVIFAISLLATIIYNIHILAERALTVTAPTAGGVVADRLTFLSIKIIGEFGSYIFLGGLILVLIILTTSLNLSFDFNLKMPGVSMFRRLSDLLWSGLKSFFSFGWLPSVFESDDDDEDDEYELDEVDPAPIGNEAFKKELSAVLSEGKESRPVMPKVTKRKTEQTPKAAPVKTAEQLQLATLEYKYPTIDLLTDSPEELSHINHEELDMTARMLAETLETFGIGIQGKIDKYPGPIITRYEFKPATGIKVNQILNLSDDLALALKARRIRIIAPIPGKAAVGVEIPNQKAQMVYLKDIFQSEEFLDAKKILPLALGKSTSGKPVVIDLAKLPHLLIAGSTGSGKSVCMNVLITSLIYRLHPHQVRFIMIDPKMLELSVYSGVPHMGRPVVTNPRRADKVLGDAVAEMEKRYKRLANASVRNIQDYNNKQTEEEARLPYIVIFVDELADLMMSTNSSKTELLITRLAQMARAVGIHLVLATQRPSVDVITGLIKANFPARIAFQVSSKVDSRTIIDGNGAEKLLGNGDMLFLDTGTPEAVRLHGAYLSNEETESIVEHINEQGLPTMALEGISQATGEVTEAEIDFGDPMFKEACEVVVNHKQGSVSLLQRRLGIGYQRAARMIDKLEQAGIVSPFDGSKAREVLVDKAFIDTLFAQGAAPVDSGVNQN